MKTIIKLAAILLSIAGLSSCDAEIKNVTVKNLVGTWDLVSETVVSYSGTETTTKVTTGEYIVITEDSFTEVNGNRETKYSFSYNDPHFIVDGANLYDVKSLTRKQLVLRANILIPLLQTDHWYTYERR